MNERFFTSEGEFTVYIIFGSIYAFCSLLIIWMLIYEFRKWWIKKFIEKFVRDNQEYAGVIFVSFHEYIGNQIYGTWYINRYYEMLFNHWTLWSWKKMGKFLKKLLSGE